MVCPVCPAAGWFGGWIGGYLGIDPPQHPGGQLFSALITANLISITVIALKSLFDISLCRGGDFTITNIARVGFKTALMGIVYSIGVNYLLNQYVFPRSFADLPPEEEPEQDAIPPCCCQKKT